MPGALDSPADQTNPRGNTSVEQAAFDLGHSTCDQFLALSTFIENGFQFKQKTGAVFLDLTAICDMVWHLGLLPYTLQCVTNLDSRNSCNISSRQTFPSPHGGQV